MHRRTTAGRWARAAIAPRAFLVLLALHALVSIALAGAPFAALTVTPAGRQTFDISTGVTTLPDGGTITDQETGVTLNAAAITYLDGVYIDASAVSVAGSFGSVVADAVRIDLVEGVLTAEGSLALERDGLTVTAGTLRYDALRQVAVFDGGVTGTQPGFETDRLLLDARTGDVLLDGHYRYQGELFTMTSPEEGGRLELRFHLIDGHASYDAATEVRPDLLERFAAFL